MKKRILATMMAVVFSLLAVFPQATAKAEENYTYLLEVTYGLLDGVNTTSCDYTVISDKIQKAYVDFMSEYAKEMEVTLTSMTDYKTSEFTITAQDWVYNSEIQGYLCSVEALFGADTYVITVSSDEYVEYLIMVTAEEAAPTLNTSKLTITAGQKSKLSVYDAAGTVTWSSNKKSVATVDEDGVVTAKKKGTAIIKAVVTCYTGESTDEEIEYEEDVYVENGDGTESEDDWTYTEESGEDWEDTDEYTDEDMEVEVDTSDSNAIKYVLKCKVVVKKNAVNKSSASSIKGSIKFKKAKVSIKVGKTKKLKVIGAKGKITWSSTRNNVATVKKGKVKALKVGKTTIIATKGNKSIKCSVTVKR